MMKKLRFIYVVLILTFLFGCEKFQPPQDLKQEEAKPPVTGTVVAWVNDYPITLEDLEEEIKTYNNTIPQDRPELKIDTREEKINYLKNEIIRRILLYQEALKRGLDKNPDIQRALKQTKQQLLVLQLVKEEADKVSVSSQEIEDYYERFKEQLREPEERKIREIVVVSQAQAKDLLIRLLQGEDFATLARQYSKAPSASKGGDLGFIKPGTKFKEFDEVAFSDALEVGEVSSVFKGSDGYYIIKLEAKRGGKLKSLSEMWDDIKRGLTFLKQQQRIEDLVGELSRNTRIEIKEDLVQ
jgi:peptidyl-prolyl cis-trans isomerase C